jgi:hypothetical protein
MKTRKQIITAVRKQLKVAHETSLEAAANKLLERPVFYKGGDRFLELGELIGKSVLVPAPDLRLGDNWEHAFVGTVSAIRSRKHHPHLATVHDQKNDAFDVEADRLTLADENLSAPEDKPPRPSRFLVKAQFWDGDECYGTEQYEVAAFNRQDADRRGYLLAKGSPYADVRIDCVVTCVVVRELEPVPTEHRS